MAGQEDRDCKDDRPGKMKHHNAEKDNVCGDHEQVSMREVDEAQNAVHHGIANGEKAVEAAQREAEYDLLKQEGRVHSLQLVRVAPGSCSRRPEPLA